MANVLRRLFLEFDFFRKLPQEHRDREATRPPDSVLLVGLSLLSYALILALTCSEVRDFATVAPLQRFDLDQSAAFDAGQPKKLRLLLNVTVHDFPCIDLSLDYQDVMGTRAVDVRSTVFKQRMNADGTVHGETMKNDPKTASGGKGLANPSIKKDAGDNVTCGDCYGALPDGECCNTCSDVLYAYRIKRWALPRIEDITQCKHDGTGRSQYQPPQILRFDDYNSDDYLPKFNRVGSLGSTESRLGTPFRLNLTLDPLPPLRDRWNFSKLTFTPLPPLNFSFFGDKIWSPLLRLNFSSSAGRLAFDNMDDEDLDDGRDEDGELLGSSKKAADASWPDCVVRNAIIHGYDIGEALMIDLTPYGATDGCWNDDCSETDKFECKSLDACAAVCEKVSGCHWWTYGPEDGVKKCWIRTGKHGREKRLGFSSGSRSCVPKANESSPEWTSSGLADLGKTDEETDVAPARRLLSFDDDLDFFSSRHSGLGAGLSPYFPMFGMDSRESEARREQKGESCRIYGYFDMNKVPGNFHIGTHGFATPSYFSYLDDPTPQHQNMRHTINNLAFVEIAANRSVNSKEPLNGFESPIAFTFQYYLTITPATVLRESEGGQTEENGYQFRSGSYVTNELIGPAVFFRLDIDPIRVTYYTESKRWSQFLVSICAVVGGCIALCSMLLRILETICHAGSEDKL